MNDTERLVWTAAFAAEFMNSRSFLQQHCSEQTIDDISGYSCAEVADVALEKYRQAINSPDAEYLIPVKEGW